MRDLKIYIALGSLLLVIYLIAQHNKPLPVDWTPTYSKDDKIPYGTYLLHRQINDILPGSKVLVRRKPVFNVFQEENVQAGNYLIIAGSINLDIYDFKKLVKYMQAGSNVFIATYYLGNFLNDTLKTTISSEIKLNDKGYSQHFTNPSLNPAKKYLFDKDIGNQYFSKLDTTRAIVLAVNNNGHSTFIKYPFGKGALYLMSSPQFFTNYNLIKYDGADFAAKSMSYLSPGGDLIWDEFSAKGPGQVNAPLSVFLNIPELKWAYYIALFSLIAFVFFEIKRRQRIIPIIQPLQNNTIEFVNVVGQVYYERKDHKNLIDKKIAYLFENIRSRYRLNTNNIDEEFITTLSNKTEISREAIQNLMALVKHYSELTKISDQQLIEFNREIENFYNKSA
ncbi:DUF4350 domain-containing protein [Daejeonella lutea]|uniref:DUF4350 domain-containing protein n=1 Tax=Daejeonella lutea TaxID=572036 RepID=A0A1T5BDB9_9SPHI|nr:DUF4350 domain-containing protein [Daejeonella lutea]SKB45067.1 hypothetical protein SAMN05661099_1504 [Daejeonella lutea]